MSELAAVDPAFEETVRTSFTQQGLMRELGARIVQVEPGHVSIELAFSDRVTQQQGLFHGAVIGAIGDIAGGYAALTLMPAGSEVVTVEYKINFVRAARGERLIAEGHILRAGRSVTVARIDVYATGLEVNDNGAAAAVPGQKDKPVHAPGNLVAVLQATFMRVAK